MKLIKLKLKLNQNFFNTKLFNHRIIVEKISSNKLRIYKKNVPYYRFVVDYYTYNYCVYTRYANNKLYYFNPRVQFDIHDMYKKIFLFLYNKNS